MFDAPRKAALKRKPSLMIVIGDAKGPPPLPHEDDEKKPAAAMAGEPDGDEAPADVECPKCGHCFDPSEAAPAREADEAEDESE